MQPGDCCFQAPNGLPLQALWRFGWEPNLLTMMLFYFLVYNHPYVRNSYQIRETQENNVLLTTLSWLQFYVIEIGVGNPQHFDSWRCYFFLVTLKKKLTLGENLLQDEFFGIKGCICDDAMIFVLFIIFVSSCTVFRIFLHHFKWYYEMVEIDHVRPQLDHVAYFG